ncbi:sentrin-specific protease 1-like [Homalodisca vitripennis]|uniref:sentrin-specific protease 1-like n=1 Tax=Homalodisca vitripennis TaxID=197043 RepID=UPI001EEAE8A9|nr:sentrin-specific protease 1-like [Homalodisca vitripennis]
MFDTFFFKDWKEKRYQAVNNRFKKEDIFQNDMLFVPVHLPDRGSGGHWILIVVMVEENTITAYDSCGWNNEAERGTVRDFLTYEATRRNRKVEAWKTVDAPKDIPRQENSYDCGAFVCMYAEVLSRKARLEGKKASGKSIRKNIASVLRAGRVGVEDFRYAEPAI